MSWEISSALYCCSGLCAESDIRVHSGKISQIIQWNFRIFLLMQKSQSWSKLCKELPAALQLIADISRENEDHCFSSKTLQNLRYGKPSYSGSAQDICQYSIHSEWPCSELQGYKDIDGCWMKIITFAMNPDAILDQSVSGAIRFYTSVNYFIFKFDFKETRFTSCWSWIDLQ